MLLLYRDRQKAPARRDTPVADGTRAIIMRSLPPHELEKNIVFQHFTGYAWHIGFFVTILFFGPHIPFLKSFLGFGWPTLPNEIITVIGAVTIAILITLMVRRMMHPVMRVISGFDDYISVIVTILPLLTGLISYANIVFDKQTNLALHLLSIALVLVWYPFGKLMHLFLVVSDPLQGRCRFRAQGGAGMSTQQASVARFQEIVAGLAARAKPPSGSDKRARRTREGGIPQASEHGHGDEHRVLPALRNVCGGLSFLTRVRRSPGTRRCIKWHRYAGSTCAS